MNIKTLTISIMLTLGLSVSLAADDPIYTGTFSNLAVGGYDPLSYFSRDGEPIKGNKQFSTQWRGAEWRFSSASNLAKFKADPLAHAPQYGGYCAWAIAQGKLAKGDAETYALVDGKLYLNYNAKVAERWNGDRQTFIEQANIRYPSLIDLNHAKAN
ncbi:MAG: YHS domain-containing (seleno)protein [Verrucomicrobiota bacterium]